MQKIDKSKIKIILVEPQLSENIGTTARAMLNFDLNNLYLVSPKQNHLSLRSLKASAGADKILNETKIFNNLEDALSEISYVFACTVRKRDMIKPAYGPEGLINIINSLSSKSNIGILFGREKSGLTNEHISYADTIIQIPTNSKFSSLNLAQAVVIIASEINRNIKNYNNNEMFVSDSMPAKKNEIIGFFDHLERALDVSGFLRPEEKKSTMMINIRNIFSRTQLTNQDVQTLRGIITALLRWPNGYKDKKILEKTKFIADGQTKNKEQTN
jgi:tRNA/rRNA methyltransferase